MALNGAGLFSRLYSWASDAANSIKISSARMDSEFDGIATALSTALYKDGQQTPTADLPMGGYKLTGLGAATAATDAAQYQQAISHMFQGRLTLTTATPIMSATVTSATTVYYTPYTGRYVSIYNGTLFVPTTFAELSQATTDTTKSPAACSASSVYDMFVWSDSGTVRCTRGPKWSSATSRGTGAGTTELELVSGVLLNKVAITNGPAANRGVYVGTIDTDTISRVNMNFGGVGAANGEGNLLGVWNMYNRAPHVATNIDTTNSWTYSTATWRLRNNAAACSIKIIQGLAGPPVQCTNVMFGSNSTAGAGGLVGISRGTDAASAVSAACLTGTMVTSTTSVGHSAMASLSVLGTIGRSEYIPKEAANAATMTWYGDNAADGFTKGGFSVAWEA